MKVTVDLAAEADIMEAADFYDMQEPGIGVEVEEFLLERLRELSVLAGVHPQRRGIYRYVVKGRFPYFFIYYEILHGSAAQIWVIQDHRRDPADLSGKLQQRFQ